MKRKILFVALALLSVLAFAQERAAIAVFPFEDRAKVFTGDESVLFYRRFSNEFVNKNNGRFRVIPRQDVEKLINTEAAFQLSDFSAKAKTAEMQRVLNGSQILSGLIGKIGNKLTISISLYTYPDLEQLPGGVDIDVANKDELFAKIPNLVQSMMTAIAGGGTAGQAGTASPNSAQAYLERGKTFYNRDDYDTAIQDFSDAIKLDHNLAEAYAYRALAYIWKENYEQGLSDTNTAISDANTAIKLNPLLALAYYARGSLNMWYLNNYDQAIADYNQAIKLDPQFIDAYLYRGIIYQGYKDLDRAIADFNQVIKLDTQNANAYNIRGKAYLSKKDYDRAIADFEAALRINPNYKNAKENLESAKKAKSGK